MKKTASLLADEKSKEVYLKAIRYRQTLDKKDRPPFSVHDQYFPKGIISLSEKETFVDCGAYVGDTIKKFIAQTNGKYEKIVAFEPDRTLMEKIPPKQNCILINKGVWHKSGREDFICQNCDGKISQTQVQTFSPIYACSERTVIETATIDETAECSDATFIKMDIEGAELNALKGARKTILRNRPKLAVCIYHSDADMVNIPAWVAGLDLGYKLYVRHHLGALCETVLYAVHVN